MKLYSGVLWERQKPQTRGTQYVLARKKEAVSFKSCNVSSERLNISPFGTEIFDRTHHVQTRGYK